MSSSTHRFFAGKQLIVFGAGYIGGALARHAAREGARVTALTRNVAKAAELRTSGIEVIVADLAGSAWHAAVPGEVDFVLNSVSSGGGGLEGYRQSYLEGMRSILTWAGTARVGTLVYTGSTSVYPQGGGVGVDETSSTEPAGERAEVLLAAERLLRESAGLGRWFILRLAGIYGPGRHYLLDQLRAGENLAGEGSHRLNLAHRDDICAAIQSAFAAPSSIANEILNVADDTPSPKAEVVGWLADRLGLPTPRFDSTVASRRRAVVPDRVISNAKLKRVLGWQPRFPDFRVGYEPILAAL